MSVCVRARVRMHVSTYSNVKIAFFLLQVCENDILLVDVVNRVPGQGFGIHWRGQPQKETPVMDGVPMVTQCPIPSSTTFQYKFRASQAGTHMWHAQTGTSIALRKNMRCVLKDSLCDNHNPVACHGYC